MSRNCKEFVLETSARCKKSPRSGGSLRCTARDYLCGCRFLGNDADCIVHDLKKTALDVESLIGAATESKHSIPEQRHHRSVILEDSNFAVKRRGDDGRRFTLEQHGF